MGSSRHCPFQEVRCSSIRATFLVYRRFYFWITSSVLGYIFFLTLNIDQSTFEAIPLGVRFAIGVLQVVAIRAAGFATTSLLGFAPAML